MGTTRGDRKKGIRTRGKGARGIGTNGENKEEIDIGLEKGTIGERARGKRTRQTEHAQVGGEGE